MPHRILVVDDDPHIRDVIGFALEKAGMSVQAAKDGGEALALFAHEAPDLVVLDVGMPEVDGLEVCRRIRKTHETPILFLSARDEEIDRVIGLEIGGDDYVTKPFSPRELVARVNAILKRARGAAPAGEERDSKNLAHGALKMTPAEHRATLGDVELTLTSIEFAILKTFLARPRQVFSREQILEAAYGGAIHVSDRTIDSHIRNIRAKCVALGCNGVVETVHGVGFKLGRCEMGQ
jgi:two-component system OmpR family response regulator